jgi:hypothetical protein
MKFPSQSARRKHYRSAGGVVERLLFMNRRDAMEPSGAHCNCAGDVELTTNELTAVIHLGAGSGISVLYCFS